MSEAQTREAAAAAGGDGPAPDEVAQAVEAAKAAARFQDAADSLKFKASLAWDPAERERLVKSAYAKEKEAHGESKKARIIASGWGQGAGLGAGISAGVGMGLGNLVGALVGGVVAVPGTLIGSGVGALHGPFYKLKDSIIGGIAGGDDQLQAGVDGVNNVQGAGLDSESDEDVKTHLAVVEAARKLEQEGKGGKEEKGEEDGAGGKENKSAATGVPPAGSAAPQVQKQEGQPTTEAADVAEQVKQGEPPAKKQESSTREAEPAVTAAQVKQGEPPAKKQETAREPEPARPAVQAEQGEPAVTKQETQEQVEPANTAAQVNQGEPAVTKQDSQEKVEPANTAPQGEQGEPAVEKQDTQEKVEPPNTAPQGEQSHSPAPDQPDPSEGGQENVSEAPEPQAEDEVEPIQPPVELVDKTELEKARAGAGDTAVQPDEETPTVDQAKSTVPQGLLSQAGGLKMEHLAYIPKAIDGAKSLGIIGSKDQKREDASGTETSKTVEEGGPQSGSAGSSVQKQEQKSKGGWFFGGSADKGKQSEAEEPASKVPADKQRAKAQDEAEAAKSEKPEGEKSKGGWFFGKSTAKAEQPNPDESAAEDSTDKKPGEDKDDDDSKTEEAAAAKSKGGWFFGKSADKADDQSEANKAEAEDKSKENKAEAGG